MRLSRKGFSSPHIEERVLRTIRRYGLFAPGARVLVAFSGGPDSVALVHLLRGLERRGELALAGLAHFNHQLRGEEADGDERFCRQMAAELGLPIDVGRADVAALARQRRRSVEDTARSVRYAFFSEAASRLGADAIALGHSLDDQAETFLLRLLRGAGPKGLAGIRPRVGNIVRPLLDLPRAELRRYVVDRALPYREDASNQDVSIPRNRVRHELLPLLERYSPGIVAILTREAQIAREDEAFLDAAAAELGSRLVSETERGVEIDAGALTVAPAALAARVARDVLQRNAPDRFVGFEHVRRVLDLARDRQPGAAVALPGQVGWRLGSKVVLGSAPDAPFSNFFRFPLSIPGEVALTGWAISAQRLESPVPPGARARGHEVMVAVDSLREPLAVRSRRPGDRFRPLGMGGRGRKLQDFLVDRKVPRADRDRLPLVVDRDDKIVWVVGHSVAEDFRVTAPSQGVILLKARPLGGAG